MKTYKNLFTKMIEPENIRKCVLDAAVGKIKRHEVLDAFRYFDQTCGTVIACAKDANYNPCENNVRKIIDGTNHKVREIEKPKFCPEQILHHMLIEYFKPVLMNGLYEQVYGSLPPSVKVDHDGRLHIKRYGVHAAVKQLKKWIQVGKKIFVCETDIHHAYASVHIATLARKMERVIKDSEWLRLTFHFLHYKPIDENLCGLILGHYTSPWFFNFYLKDFDHYAASLDGVKYLRFADNIYLVGTNKRKVHRALKSIREHLRHNLKMELNSSTQVYRFEYVDKQGKVRGRAVNALGMVIHHNRVTLRKSLLLRIRRKALRIGRKSNTNWHDAASMFSRLTWIRHTNTYTFYTKHIKPYINTRNLKVKIRRHSKYISKITNERRRIINDGLEKSFWLSSL